MRKYCYTNLFVEPLDYLKAQDHLRRLRKYVDNTITIGRAFYWEGTYQGEKHWSVYTGKFFHQLAQKDKELIISAHNTLVLFLDGYFEEIKAEDFL